MLRQRTRYYHSTSIQMVQDMGLTMHLSFVLFLNKKNQWQVLIFNLQKKKVHNHTLKSVVYYSALGLCKLKFTALFIVKHTITLIPPKKKGIILHADYEFWFKCVFSYDLKRCKIYRDMLLILVLLPRTPRI